MRTLSDKMGNTLVKLGPRLSYAVAAVATLAVVGVSVKLLRGSSAGDGDGHCPSL